MTAKRAYLAGLASAIGALSPTPARAQDATSRATAVQLFDEGDRLMAAGKPGEACPKYAASNKLDPQLGALLHLADCYAKNGQLASAWSSFRDATEIAQQRGDDRAAFAKDQATALEARLSRLTLVVSEAANVAGLEIKVDGAVIIPSVWGVAAPTDPGMHAVQATAPGRRPWSSSFKIVGERQSLRVDVPVLEGGAAAPGLAPTPAGSAPAVSHDSDRAGGGGPWKIVGWASVGVGVAALGVGTVFLVKKGSTLEDRDQVCPSYHCTTDEQVTRIHSLTSDASSQATLSAVGFVAGGVLVAGGVAALLFGPSSDSRPSVAWVAPAVTPGGFALAGGGRF